MKKTAFMITIIFLALPLTCFAQEKVSREDRLIGSTFKALAKVFLATADFDTLKKNNIGKLRKMDEAKFKKRYARVYEVIKDLPVELKVSYGVTEAMTKEQGIKNIETLDKDKAYKTIDSIPDTIIAEQFKKYLGEKKEEIQKSSLAKQINNFWDKMLEQVNRLTPKRP